MAIKQEEKAQAEQQKKERQMLDEIIGNQVIHTLGRPVHLHRVQVSPLWHDHYRVNVLVGLDASCVKVVHSYFLVADSEGKIINSTPKISRLYE